MKSCSHKRTKGCRGSGRNREQVASERSKRATTILAVLFCCYTVCYFITNLVCLLSNRVCLPSNGVSLFSGERVLENTPTPIFEQPLKYIAHGHIFKSLRYRFLGRSCNWKVPMIVCMLHVAHTLLPCLVYCSCSWPESYCWLINLRVW